MNNENMDTNATVARFYNPDKNFYFEAPENWNANYHPEYRNIVQAVAPDGSVAVTASGYGSKEGFGLREFADARFESKEEFLAPANEELSFENGVYLELEGTYPGDNKLTYYVMGAVMLKSGFVSFSIVTSKEDFEKNRGQYVKIMSSTNVV